MQDGKRPADVGIGRQLADAVAGVPHMGRAEFEAMLTNAAQVGARAPFHPVPRVFSPHFCKWVTLISEVLIEVLAKA